MKRIEVRLSLPVVAPLLDAVREVSEALKNKLAAPLEMGEVDEDLRDIWHDELISAQNDDMAKLMAMFGSDFFAEGVIVLDEDNAEPVLRACAALRLRLREQFLKTLSDETLESGAVEIEQLDESLRKAFTCYLFLATLEELIIQYLDTSAGEE